MNKKGCFGEIVFILGVFIFFAFILINLFLFIDYNINNYPVQVSQEGIIIYTGIKACISIDSSGDTTTITIFKPFWFCAFPERTITGRGIEIK